MLYYAPDYVDVFDGTNNYAVDISVGALHNLAITADGRVMSWGSADLGRLGIGNVTTSDDKVSPVEVTVDDGSLSAISVATGGATSYVVLEDGFVWSFGENTHGQLGDAYAGEDPAHYKPGTTNASDSNEFSPVLVTGRTMKLIPSSLKLYIGSAPYQMKVSFNRFNLIKDNATTGDTYKWEITNEMDKDGVTALIPGSLVSVDSDGKVSGKTKEGVATLVVTDVKTGTKQTAYVEVADASDNHVEAIVFDYSKLDDTATQAAVEKGYLDSDEYTEIISVVGDKSYKLVDPLKSVYTGLVQTTIPNATTVTVHVKSIVDADVIYMVDKNGQNPVMGTLLTDANIGSKDPKFIGYYEFTDVPISELEDNYYFEFKNSNTSFDGIYKAHTTRYSNDGDLRIVKVGENDPATDVADWVYYDQPENHIKLKDAAVSDYVRMVF